jgi:hypothetical protein
VEADPAAFAASGVPAVRSLTLAVIWHGARNRAANGENAALTRVNALLTTLAMLETDASVKSDCGDARRVPAETPAVIFTVSPASCSGRECFQETVIIASWRFIARAFARGRPCDARC